jgi:hypothetical protein
MAVEQGAGLFVDARNISFIHGAPGRPAGAMS